MRNKFHPVRELLDSLTWDGKEHIRSLLPEYLGAEDSDYTYQVMRLWMLGAVSRVYKPEINLIIQSFYRVHRALARVRF